MRGALIGVVSRRWQWFGCLLFFIGMMIGRKKNTWRQWLCVLIFVFERSKHMTQKQRRFVWLLSSSCLKRIRTRGEDNDNHKWSLSFFFIGTTIAKKEDTKTMVMCHHLVSERSRNKRWRWQCLYGCYRFLFFERTRTRREKKTWRWQLCVVVSMSKRSWKRRRRRSDRSLSFSSIFHKSNDKEKYDDITVVFL